jgi:hypothetical protein
MEEGGNINLITSNQPKIDLRYLQKLLEHKNNKKPEIYTHASNRNLKRINNLLNNLGVSKYMNLFYEKDVYTTL